MIELFTIPAGIPENIDRGRPIVIIDIFRASTSITAALAAGAKEIYVAGSREEARVLKKHPGEDVLLAGERGGFMIEGYDLGNSPREMVPDKVKGKTIIFNSTNGTKLLRKFEDFTRVIVGSIVSSTATIKYLERFDKDPVFCCAATEGRFSNEDTLAAGLMIEKMKLSLDEMDDAAASAVRLVELAGDKWSEWAANSFHGRTLKSLGFGEDLPVCLDLDRYDFVPVKQGDRIISGNGT